jgi:hypothetical protein
MDVTRLSLARVLELGIPITWREAGAVLVEAVDRARQLGGTGTAPVKPASVLLTRGGEVVLAEHAERAHPDAVAALAADLLRACADPGDLGEAVASGELMAFLDALGHETTWKRRRVQVATLALRAIATHADQLRSTMKVRTYDRHRRDDDAPRPSARPARHHEAAATVPARRLSARVIIWTVVALSATAAGLSAWRAEAGPFAPSPSAQGPFGRR